MSDFFERPPAGTATTATAPVPWPYTQKIEYRACKTEPDWVSSLNAQILAERIGSYKLGFHYYDRDARHKKGLKRNEFSFVVLDCFSQITGKTKDAKTGQYTEFFSNRVKNSKEEPFAVWMSGEKRPIYSGMYDEIKKQLPQGVGFDMHLVCYCFQTDGLIDITLTQMVKRAIQRAMIQAEHGADADPAAYANVKLWDMGKDGVLWGFKQTTFARVDEKGNPYPAPPKGNLYFEPVFEGGIVPDAGETKGLYAACIQLQAELRAAHAYQKSRYGTFSPGEQQEHEQGTTIATAAQSPTHTPAVSQGPPTAQPWPDMPTDYQPPVQLSNWDDLPF